jgi:hypothetical protein
MDRVAKNTLGYPEDMDKERKTDTSILLGRRLQKGSRLLVGVLMPYSKRLDESL